MNISSFIRPAKTVSEDETVTKALSKLTHSDYDALCVVKGKKLKGVVTLSSLLSVTHASEKVKKVAFMPKKVGRQEKIEPVIEYLVDTGLDNVPVVSDKKLLGEVRLDDLISNLNVEGKVLDCMHDNPITLGPESPISTARALMRMRGIQRIIVVEKNEIAGILTERDVLRNIVPVPKKEDMFKDKKKADIPVKDIMTKEVITTSADAPLKDVLSEMIRKNIKAMPVVSPLHMGLVRKRDIVNFAYRRKKERALVTFSGIEEIDPFTMNHTRKMISESLRKIKRHSPVSELQVVYKKKEKGPVEISIRLIGEGKYVSTIKTEAFDYLSALSKALRKMEKETFKYE